MAVSLNEVAKQAGVSVGTASHVLNGNASARIAKTTQERVRLVADRLGYIPNPAARALAKGATKMIAAQDYDFLADYSSTLVSHLRSCCAHDGYELSIHIVSGDLRALAASVDGIVAFDYIPSEDLRPVLAPYVSVGVFAARERDHVVIDLYEPACQALEAMVQNGRKRIAYLAGRDPLHLDDPRERAYLGVMAAAGLEPQVLWCEVDTRTQGYAGMSAYLARGTQPDAIFCRNDELAIGALRAVREHGLSVPGDIAIMGCDGIEASEFTFPALSTIQTPFVEVCQQAWRMLLARIRQPDLATQSATYAGAVLYRETFSPSTLENQP